MTHTVPLLSYAIWVPIVAGLLVLATGGDRNAALQRWLALAGALTGFLVTLPLYANFDLKSSGMQFVELAPWIEQFNVHYHLGVDGISLLFVLLNSFITVLVVIAGWSVIGTRVAQYLASFLILSGLLNGVFAALDALLFYVFFEATLIPMFIIIGVWGGPNRVYAALKFFLYTLMGSLLMLVAMLYLYGKSGGSFSILDWHKLPLPLGAQVLLFFGFLLAFAVKVPMWPVHTWLPDAHVEAPTAGSVILAGVLLKFGGYGFLRFSLPMLPAASEAFAPLIFALSVIAVVYTSLVALAQEDMKKLIAYSSVAHMGFVTAGAFSFTLQGIEGAIFQMLSHGVVSAALFLIVGVVYDRTHSRDIETYGGLVHRMPAYAFAFMVFMLASVGLPGTSGFVGEILVLIGLFQVNVWVAALTATGVILGAVYMLYLYRRVIFGRLTKEALARIGDLSAREIAVFAPLVVLVFWMGIFPAPFLKIMHVSSANLVRQVDEGRRVANLPGAPVAASPQLARAQ